MSETIPNNFDSFLMTPEQYAQCYEHETPYLYHLTGGGKDLLYFGAEHTNDPAHPALAHLAEEFIAFQPSLALIEGILQVNGLSNAQIVEYTTRYSREELIKKMGEKAVVTKLAVESGCRVYSPEPDDGAIAQFLEKQGYTRDEIFIEQVANQIPQFARQSVERDLEKYMQPYFSRMQENLRWAEYVFSLEHFMSLHALLLGREFNLQDIPYYIEVSDPIPWPDKLIPYGRINMLAASLNKYRDSFMVQNVLEQFKSYNRIFIVYGASHAVMQEPALRKMFESF